MNVCAVGIGRPRPVPATGRRARPMTLSRVRLPWPATPPRYGAVVLRPLTAADTPMVIALGQEPYIPLIGSLPARPTSEQAEAWIRRQHDRHTTGAGLTVAVADADSGEALGMVGLGLRDLADGRATGGYSIAPPFRGRGVARSALIALTAYAWTVPALHRIELYVEPVNTASIRVAEAAGYVLEGLLRNHQEIGGVRRDMLVYAAVRPSS